MDLLRHYLLTSLIFLPLIWAIPVVIVRGGNAVRWTALAGTLVTFCASLVVLVLFDWRAGSSYAYAADGGVVQLVQRADWVAPLHIQYLVGVDGLNLPLVMLCTFIGVLAAIASWNVERMSKGYFALLLLLESAILGTLLSLDFFLFYIFLQMSLLPIYLLIGVWGGPRREYAGIKFFLYTLVGSIALLLVMIALYLYSRRIVPGGTFDMIRMAGPEFQQKLAGAMGGAHGAIAYGLFLLLLLGFFIKLPAFPLHGWLADAQADSPVAVSMILSSLLTKIGGYGILRIAYPIFPHPARSLWALIALVGVASLVWGALCALAQTDLRRTIAYGCISRMGLFTLGTAMLTTASLDGAMLMLVADGIISAALFFIADVVTSRTGQREIPPLGGIAGPMPLCGGFAAAAFFANLGLPGLCGFVPEILVVLGTFIAATAGNTLYMHAQSSGWLAFFVPGVRALAVIACCAGVLTAGYLLWTLQRVFFGPPKTDQADLTDLDPHEIAVLTPLTIMIVLLGILPWPIYFMFTSQTAAAFLKLFW
jgi:NADH-quinone oxidoreductase subunit M